MAETFTSLHDLLYAQISVKTSKTSTILKQSIVEALTFLSKEKTTFTEDEASFTTVANQATYDSTTTGFPKDLLEVRRLYYKVGSQPIEIDKVSMDELRFWMDEVPTMYPRGRSWHDRKLYLGPPPNSALVLHLDYTKDARRNTSDGALITVASTTQTNDWFDAGLEALKHKTLEIFYKTPLFQDQGRAGFAKVSGDEALFSLFEERRQHVKPSGQARAAWTGGEGNETDDRRLWGGRYWTHE
jgi:hypothetical protein